MAEAVVRPENPSDCNQPEADYRPASIDACFWPQADVASPKLSLHSRPVGGAAAMPQEGSIRLHAVALSSKTARCCNTDMHCLLSTKQPPAEAGGFELRTGSPDTRRLNDASTVAPSGIHRSRSAQSDAPDTAESSPLSSDRPSHRSTLAPKSAAPSTSSSSAEILQAGGSTCCL